MRIRKNGKVIRLTERQLGNIVKRVLSEEENKKRKNLFTDDFKKEYIPNFCKMIRNMEYYSRGGWPDLSKQLRRYNENKLKELKMKNILDITTPSEMNEFIDLLPREIYNKWPDLQSLSNMTRGAVETTNKKVLYSMVGAIFQVRANVKNGDVDGDGIPNRLDLDPDGDGDLDV